MSLSDNRNVVGQADGSTVIFGYKFDGGLDWRGSGHEVRNTLEVAASVTQNPLVDQLTKASDGLELESIYLYHVLDWVGPFARFNLATTTMAGIDRRPEPVVYAVSHPDDSVSRHRTTRLLLTDPFKPLKLKESAGAFFQPFSEDAYNLEFRVGAGGREIFADGQRAIADDEGTEDIEVSELQDVLQFGAEAAASFWGNLYTKKVTYKAGAEVMVPFANNQDDRNALDLTNVELRAGLSFRLIEWAALDYQFKALREAQLIDEFQLQNNLLLTFGLSTGSASAE